MDGARHLKVLCDRIKQLGKTEHDEILKRLKKYDVTMTENNNGIFINMSNVHPDAITDIEEFVKFCVDNKQHLDEYDTYIQKCKLGINSRGTSAINNAVYDDVASDKDPGGGEAGPVENVAVDAKVAENELIQSLMIDNIETLQCGTDTRYIHIKKKYMKRKVVEYKDTNEKCLDAEPYILVQQLKL
jgi:hypothetical protein